MTEYQQLYDYCQTLPCPPYIKRNAIRDKALEITGKKAMIIAHGLDLEVCRGLFIQADDPDSPFSKHTSGRALIVLGRGMNDCWERFVQTKELMHLFDSDDEKTSSGDQIVELLNDFVAPTPRGTNNPRHFAENKAIWMALACLCPEATRQQLVAEYKNKHVDHYAVALQLKIPERYVPHLLHPHFLDFIGMCFTK